tara:strand:- start:988 stop:2655 length:1668 start_codon:yes stop_codon:yes gene_type:complete
MSIEYIEPPSFPVIWNSEEERNFTWVWDDVHTPIPNTPLTSSFSSEWSRPRPGETPTPPPSTTPALPRRRIINGYAYSPRIPKPEPPVDPPSVESTIDRLSEARNKWDTDLLPKLQGNLAKLRGIDLASTEASQLPDTLELFVETHREHWQIHMQAVGPIFQSTGVLSSLYDQLTSSDNPLAPYELLQGFHNKSLETDQALRVLANEALHTPPVHQIMSYHTHVDSMITELKNSSQCSEYIASVDRFLDSYGFRSSSLDLSIPTWQEDPSFVFLTIKSLLSPLNSGDSTNQDLAAKREESVEALRDSLDTNDSNYDLFFRILKICQDIWPIREDHAFYIEQATGAQMRRIALRCGETLVQQGLMSDSRDIFYLELDEIRKALTLPPASETSESYTALIADRKEKRNHFLTVTPPQYLGHPPTDELLQEKMETTKFIPHYVESVEDPSHPNVLRGIGASAGTYRGIARVILTTEDFAKVEPGDILICKSTTPPWTPLFATIGGLVTDAGGILSHGAIVAREYGLPAVMATKRATTSITDGAILVVDGTTGIVQIEE